MNPRAGGEGPTGRGQSHDASRAGHIPCVICLDVIGLDQYQTARCWTDPHGATCAAHAGCLVRVGEWEIGLV